MRMFEIDQTPIYRFFLKKGVLWCLVSGMYIPTLILTRHHKTPQKQNRYQAKKNPTPQLQIFAQLFLSRCPEVSGYD
jgi:hypothetical protein